MCCIVLVVFLNAAALGLRAFFMFLFVLALHFVCYGVLFCEAGL